MYLKPPNSLSPEAPNVGDTDLTATIPNGYVGDGPLGRGIFKWIGHTEWREVGIWTTAPVKETINLGGEVKIKMWAMGNPSNQNQVNCNFEFIISRANEANAIVQVTRNNVRIPAGTSGEYVMFEAQGTLPFGNETTIEANGQLSIRIRAQVNGGAILVYGTTAHDSGFEFDSNALRAHNLLIDREGISVEYHDAFLVPYTKMHKRLIVNNIELDNQDLEIDFNSMNQTRVFLWPRDNGPGSYDVMVSISYDPSGLRNVSQANVLRISMVKKDTGEIIKAALSSMAPFLLIIFILVLSFVVFRKQRKKVWHRRLRKLPESTRGLSRRKQKRAWKKIMKEERLKKKVQRRDDRLKKLDEDETFSLFKKDKEKKKESPRVPRRGRAAPVEALDIEVSEDRIEDLSSLEL
jgi:hypothetical protein